MVYFAILGFGVVGSGVAEVADKNAATIRAKAAEDIRLKYILDVREFPDSPYADKVIHDFSVIEHDPEIQVVVETIGGKGVAYEFTKRALLAGKNVVTSNKELVAEHGVELIKLAHERNLNYLFEASVGGGIPIIRPLTQCLSANNLNEICGILNGTTNYILTRMIRAGLSFDDALAEAKAKGYAEQNPTADIDGHDACRKICILSALAYGRHIYPREVLTEGIRGVALHDVEYAKSCGRVIKLLGRSVHRPDGRVNILVAPHLVSLDSPLAGVEDVFNGIVVNGNAIGDVMFYGRGAGKLPTASAVVADIIDVSKHLKSRKYLDWEDSVPGYVADPGDMEYAFYVRVEEGPGVARQIESVFPDASHLPGNGGGDRAFLTGKAATRQIMAQLESLKLAGIPALSAIRVL